MVDPAASRPAVLVSRCLLGVPCRYHGKTHRMGKRIGRPALIERLGRKYRLIDVCPECDAGLPTPRSPTRIVNGRWICNGQDVTAVFREGAEIALAAAHREGCRRLSAAWLAGVRPGQRHVWSVASKTWDQGDCCVIPVRRDRSRCRRPLPTSSSNAVPDPRSSGRITPMDFSHSLISFVKPG